MATTDSTTTRPPVAADATPRSIVLRFAVPAVGVTWAVQLGFLAAGWPIVPALFAELAVLVALATRLTFQEQGRANVRALFAQAARWRFPLRWYALALLLLPVCTVLVAAAAGQLHGSPSTWGSATVTYLLSTVVVGALLGNVWEELAWTGYLQRRLTPSVGLFRAAMLTAVPFSVIHLPLAFEAHGLHHTPARTVAVDWAVLVVVAPFFRYLLALVWDRTGGSVWAAALVHASFNACGSLAVVRGGWEYVVAALVGSVLVASVVRLRSARTGER